MKSYHDIAADGGSSVLDQIEARARKSLERLADVRRVVAIMSGKGGVGKSTMTVNLAAALARRGLAVGIVDGDVNGPSLGRMAGVHGRPIRHGPDGAEAVLVETAPTPATAPIKIMSMDLFLDSETAPIVWHSPTQRDAYAWRGLMEAAALRELITDTAWGRLDCLLVDLPPGSDRLPNLADVLPTLSGAVVITMPSAISLGVVGRSIRMARDLLETPIFGIVENMAGYVCHGCGALDELFPSGGVERLAADLDVPILGSIPFDPLLGICADEGRFFVTEYPDRAASASIRTLADRLVTLLETTPSAGSGMPEFPLHL